MKQTETVSHRGENALLVRVEGRDETVRFVGSCRIGRAPHNDLVIDDPSVSQRHVEVVFESGSWRLRDLESTNGTVVRGVRIEAVTIEGPLRVRLGYQGPALVLTPEGVEDQGDPEDTAVPSESAILKRYFARNAPTDISAHTAALRRALRGVQRQRAKKYLVALLVVAIVGASASGYAYHLRKEIKRQRAAAEDLFYSSKNLELAIAKFQRDAADRQSYRTRHDELEVQYRDYMEELGIYDDKTPDEVRLIYRVAHRFGESEVNIPKEFVDEVRRYIKLWKTTPRLREAMERAQQNGYGQRIAQILLEHDLPPEFFYLALQESDLNVESVGPRTRFGIAKGMWQFIPGTARDYGLKTGPLVGVGRKDPLDDRHDFEKSTRAAAKYLRRIYMTDAQASGLLVIASYNWGQTKVLRLIRSMPENPRQRNFWQLLVQYRDQIPKETYDYVFSIVSAAVIGESPELFGFDFESPFSRQDLAAEASDETGP